MNTKLKGKDFITTQDFSVEELNQMLELASELKMKFTTGQSHEILKNKTLFMIFYNQSLRTRNSFEAGMTQLGGHAHFLDPKKIYTPALEGDEKAYSTERVSDVARVLSRMGHGISIRIYGEPTGWIYGKGNLIVKEFAKWSDIPVINMECDKFHPCQVMADLLTIKEKLGTFKDKKFVMSWAYTPSIEKPLAVPQSCILGTTKMGMDVVLAYPKGLELDPEIIKWSKENAEKQGGSFEIVNDMDEAFGCADVIYPKSWTSAQFLPPQTKKLELDKIKKVFEKNKDWVCTNEKLGLCKKDVLYMHCLPADRGFEVTDDVIDGPNSVVFDEAENRLHVQKAIMSLTM